jgi:flagellar hook-basal body complex protein FliE
MTPIQPIGYTGALPATSAVTSGAGGGNFGQTLSNVLNGLAQVEGNTNSIVAGAATGNSTDVHDVMIATQAESLAFQLATQVRNKLVEAYQEVFRMQI